MKQPTYHIYRMRDCDGIVINHHWGVSFVGKEAINRAYEFIQRTHSQWSLHCGNPAKCQEVFEVREE